MYSYSRIVSQLDHIVILSSFLIEIGQGKHGDFSGGILT